MAPRQQVSLQTVPSRVETLCCAWHPLLATALPMAYAIALGLKRKVPGKVTRVWEGGVACREKQKNRARLSTPLLDVRVGGWGWLEVQDVPLRKKKKRRSARTHWAWTGPHTCTHAHTGWVFWHGQAANVNRHSVLVISTNIGLSPGQGHPHSFFAVNLRDSMSARLPHFYEWRRYIPCFGSA
jgi:hypothetical protein